MKKTVVLVTTAVAGVAAIAALSSWAGANTPSKSAHRPVRYVRTVGTRSFYVDNDPSGNSGGDLFGGSGDLRHGAQKVGRYTSACTAASPAHGQCQVTFIWGSGGRIQLAGDFRIQSTHKNRLAIVGGTGIFRSARGDATFQAANTDPAVQRVSLTILR